jgi:hypothetical protein
MSAASSLLCAAGPLAALLLLVGSVPSRAEPPLPPPRPFLIELPQPPDVSSPTSSPVPAGRQRYFAMVQAEAREHGLPVEIADAVMRVESSYNPDVIGGVGERGLMQVLPSTARMLGFRGTLDELADPAVNIGLGVRYLAGAWRLAGGDLCRTLMKYRAGHGAEKMSALSVEYCRRAKVHLASLGSGLAVGELPPVTLRGPLAAKERPLPNGLARRGHSYVVVNRAQFWKAHEARIAAIKKRLGRKLI